MTEILQPMADEVDPQQLAEQLLAQAKGTLIRLQVEHLPGARRCLTCCWPTEQRRVVDSGKTRDLLDILGFDGDS
jgi:hypothetical protein